MLPVRSLIARAISRIACCPFVTEYKLHIGQSPSSPDSAHAGTDIDAYTVARRACRGSRHHLGPCCLLEEVEQSLGNEARPRRINVPIAMRAVAMAEEALRADEVKIVLGARHGDMEQTPLLLDLGGRPSAEIGGNASVDDLEHENGSPFLPLGGMDRRKD